jgi:hypothetical protein
MGARSAAQIRGRDRVRNVLKFGRAKSGETNPDKPLENQHETETTNNYYSTVVPWHSTLQIGMFNFQNKHESLNTKTSAVTGYTYFRYCSCFSISSYDTWKFRCRRPSCYVLRKNSLRRWHSYRPPISLGPDRIRDYTNKLRPLKGSLIDAERLV